MQVLLAGVPVRVPAGTARYLAPYPVARLAVTTEDQMSSFTNRAHEHVMCSPRRSPHSEPSDAAKYGGTGLGGPQVISAPHGLFSGRSEPYSPMSEGRSDYRDRQLPEVCG